MGIRDWFRRRPTGQQEQRVVAEWGSSAIPGPTETQVSSYASAVGELRSAETSLQKVAVWAAVDLIASVSSWVPLDTYRRTGPKTSVQIPNGKLIEDPGGEGYGVSDWIYQYLVSKLLRGNAYGRLLSPDPSTGYPTQVLLFHPDYVQGWRDTIDGRTRWYVEGRQITWKMWHQRSYTMPGALLGLSPVRQHIVTIGEGLAAARFGLQYFTDGGIPGGLLTNEEVDLDPKKAKVAKARFMASMHGSREPLVLGKGWKYDQVQVAPEESQFLETQKYTAAECARIFGPSVAEILGYETGGSMTYNTMVDRDLTLLKYALNRWFRDVESVLNPLLPKPQFVKFNRPALLEMDLLSRYKSYQLGISSKFLHPDEAREHEDLPPLTEDQKRELIELNVKAPGLGGEDGDAKTARADDVGPKEQRAVQPDDDDEDAGPLDEDCLALLAAMHELGDEGQVERAWDPAKHPRNPKGSPGGGRFRSMVDRLKDALQGHSGDGDPFDGFDREQLRKVAKARGITLKRGEDRDSIAQKLLADLKGGGGDSTKPRAPRKPKVPTPEPPKPKSKYGTPAGTKVRDALAKADSLQAINDAADAEAARLGAKTRFRLYGDKQVAREHAEGILRGLERFPKADVRSVDTAHWSEFSAPTTYAHAFATRGIIQFSDAWSTETDVVRYRNALKQDVAVGFHPDGTDNPIAVAVHEFGHVLDGRGLDGQPLHAAADAVWHRHDGPARQHQFGAPVSRYAAHSTWELVAEAFADVVMNGDNAGQPSKEIYDLMVAAYETKYGVKL